MRSRSRLLSAMLIAGAIASPVVVAGCFHHGYSNSGSSNNGYSNGRWNDSEGPYYSRWEQDTHRDHKDWSQRNADEQQQYWSWRHDHQ